MLVLKDLFDWSLDECEREVRASLVYRAFCRIEGERAPVAKTLIRLAQVLDGPTLKQLLARLVAIADERHVVRGRRLRGDTTVVETNIHYPTDSSLLGDGVRVLIRNMKKITKIVGEAGAKLRDRSRSVKLRMLDIARAAWRAYQQLLLLPRLSE
jgi:IS5 family transposase